MMMRTLYVTLAVIAAVLLGVGGFAAYRESVAPKPPSLSKPPSLAPSPDSNAIPTMTAQEQARGWYWGTAAQKKPETPNDWVYEEAGRSSCWHSPSVTCTETTYTCPENGWENCMPILTEEAQRQCTKEALEWKKAHCPNFRGAAQ